MIFRSLLLMSLFTAGSALGFPEMVRHGYLSCVACHYNPNGGAILRPFGRAIAQDPLSHWGADGESDFLYGALPTPEWLKLGGDLRQIQVYRNNSQARDGKFFMMQADFEAAIEYEQWTLVGSMGPDANPVGGAVSRRHYLLLRSPAESRLYFQAGKYLQPYGINTPDHVISIKRGLGWDQTSETYNVSAIWMDQGFDAFLTANLGRPDDETLDRESGFAFRPRVYIDSMATLGVSYAFGKNSKAKRHVFGPYTTIGISNRCFILAELDFQNRHPSNNADSEWGLVSYLKFDYEPLQGVHVFATQEFSQLNFKDDRTMTLGYGLGAQFFPRPHWELTALWQKQKVMAVADEYQDFAWFLLHFYL